MDKTKEIFNNSLQKIKETDLDIKNIKMKIFDNIVWVIILSIVFFILIVFYLSNQSFNVQYKLDSLDKDYKNIIKLSNIDKKSEFQNTESFDEIDINKHTLKELYISSSAKSYLVGRQMLDYCSKEMIMKCIELGARFIDIDIYLGEGDNIVICNGLSKGNWKLTLNTFLFRDFIKILSEKIFDSNTYFNYNDPLILLLNINIPKRKLSELYEILYENLKDFLPDKKYSIKNGENILDAKLKELLKKIVIITNGPIGNSKMMEIVHLRIGDRVRLISFKELYNQKDDYNIDFNKKHLTIVKPEVGIRSLNYNPERAWEYGCQIVSLHFQVEDDFMKEYINKFRNKSYLLKPYEFTKFIDKPQIAYDRKKTSYYPTYKEDDLRFIVPTKIKTKKCCKPILNFDDYIEPLELLNLNFINIMGNYDKIGSAPNFYLKKRLNEHLLIITNFYSKPNDRPEETEFTFFNIHTNDSINKDELTSKDYETIISDPELKQFKIAKKKFKLNVNNKNPSNDAENTKVIFDKKYYESLCVSFKKITNKFVCSNKSDPSDILYSIDESKDPKTNKIVICIKNNLNNIILKAYKNEKQKFTNFIKWTDFNSFNWLENDDEIFTDTLYFYTFIDENDKEVNYIISLHYIYFLLKLNSQFNLVKIKYDSVNDINIFNLKLKNSDSSSNTYIFYLNRDEYEANLGDIKIQIKFEKKIISTDSDLDLKNANLYDLNSNNYNVFVNNKKIFNLNLHFLNNSQDNIGIEYKNQNLNLNKLREKLKTFKIQEHQDIRNIQNINNNFAELNFFINRHIYSPLLKDLFTADYYNKYDLIYYILHKQIKLAFNKQKNEDMIFDYDGKCSKTNINECEKQTLCYIKEIAPGKTCESDKYKIPYSNLCTPREIVSNRNSCLSKKSDDPANNTKIKNLRNKENRQFLHNMHTDYNLGINGKWYNRNGEIFLDIPNTFSEYCETVFTTKEDNKTYSMKYVYESSRTVSSIDFGNMIKYDNDIKKKTETLLARGTFIDNNLREYEKKNNLLQLKIHGYCEIKVYLKDFKIEIPKEKFTRVKEFPKCINVHVMEAYYKYDSEMKNNTSYNSYKESINIDFDFNEAYLLNSYKPKDDKLINNYLFYRLNDPECNDQLIKRTRLTKNVKTDNSNIYTKEDLEDIEYNEGFIGNMSSKILDFDSILAKINKIKKTPKKVEKVIKETPEETKKREKEEIKEEIENFFFFKNEEEIKILKSLNLSKEELNNFKLLNDIEETYFNKLSTKEKKDFLNKSKKEKEKIIKESKYYETPKTKEEGGLSMDMIQDGESDDYCLKRRMNLDESSNCRKVFLKENKKRPRKEVCNIDECVPLNPVLSSCSMRGEQEPYCSDNSFGKWDIRRKGRIKLNYEGPNEICELEDTDYNLHKSINKKKLTIGYYINLKKTIDTIPLPEEPPGLKEEIQNTIKELMKVKKELVLKQNKAIDDGLDGKLGEVNKEIRKIDKKIANKPIKIKEKYKKKMEEDIKKLEEEILILEEQIVNRKKSGSYSNISNNRCLGHGTIRRPHRSIFYRHIRSKDRRRYEPRLLYCDHRKNIGGRANMYKKFKFNWKVVKVVNNPPKYIIMTDDNQYCLTKKKLNKEKKKKDDEEEEEENDSIIEGDYLEDSNGKLEGRFELKPCSFNEMDLYESEPTFNPNQKIDKKTNYIFSPKSFNITPDIQQIILHKHGYTKHMNNNSILQVLITDEGLHFLKTNQDFLQTELGKKFIETKRGKQIMKLAREFTKTIKDKHEISFKELIKYDKKILLKHKVKSTFTSINSYKDYDDTEFLLTNKGKEEIEKATPRVIKILIKDTTFKFLKNKDSQFFFNTNLGMDYLNNYLGKMFIKTEEGKQFLESDNVKEFSKKFDSMKDQLFRFKNFTNINKCDDEDASDPRNKELLQNSMEKNKEGGSDIAEKNKQTNSWQNSVPKNEY